MTEPAQRGERESSPPRRAPSGTWQLVATAVTFVLTLLTAGLAFVLQFRFGATTRELLGARAGRRLLVVALVAAALLVTGVLARIATRRASAGWAGTAAALAVLGYGAVDADARLARVWNPPDALAGFDPPAGAVERPRAPIGPDQHRFWIVPLPLDRACAVARAEFTSWADPGTVREYARRPSLCGGTGSRGDLHVSFSVRTIGEETLLVVAAKPSEAFR